MNTTLKPRSSSWYDTPYGQLAERAGHRNPQPTVAQVLSHLTDSSQVGLAWALATGPGRIPIVP